MNGIQPYQVYFSLAHWRWRLSFIAIISALWRLTFGVSTSTLSLISCISLCVNYARLSYVYFSPYTLVWSPEIYYGFPTQPDNLSTLVSYLISIPTHVWNTNVESSEQILISFLRNTFTYFANYSREKRQRAKNVLKAINVKTSKFQT